MDDRHLDLDLLAAVDAQQVGVVDVEGQRVLVQGLDHGQLRLAVDVEVEDGVDAVVADDAVELDGIDEDVLRGVEVLRVDDHGDVAGDAGAAGGALAELGALAGFQLDDVGLGHSLTP